MKVLNAIEYQDLIADIITRKCKTNTYKKSSAELSFREKAKRLYQPNSALAKRMSSTSAMSTIREQKRRAGA